MTTIRRVIIGVVVLGAMQWQATHAGPPDFSSDVRPILSNRCFKCHGPDEGNREAGLRLDMEESAVSVLESGETAIRPGDRAASELINRITSDDPDLVMPPSHTNVSLSETEKQILIRWIDHGATYEPHWAFMKPQLPDMSAKHARKHPIDWFVQHRLQKEGIAPARQADPETLCRRVYFDLIGLPPSPEELDAFLSDQSPNAYEQLVDRLLASPRYGERWARRWLDLARYADTNGYEKDRPRTIWPFRDWVIRALNDDMPFDQFTIKQIAGDMLPNPTPDDMIATGFHRNTMLNEEGGIDPLEFRYLAMVDRVGTTGTTWLGLTTACAQCHTHKFDPVTHTDYFSFMALLNNADEPEWIIPSAERDRHIRDAHIQAEELWEALPDHWPSSKQSDPESVAVDAREDKLQAGKNNQHLPMLTKRFESWLHDAMEQAVCWQIVVPEILETNLPHLVPQEDGSILGSGDITKSDVYELTFPAVDYGVRAIRLEVLPDPSLPDWGPGLCYYEGRKGDFFLSEFEVSLPDKGTRIEIEHATESFDGKAFAGKKSFGARAAVDGVMSSGWSTNGHQGQPEAAVFCLSQPIQPGTSIRVTMRFERHFACSLGRFRVSFTDDEHAKAHGMTSEEELALITPVEDRTPMQNKRLLRRFLATAPELSDQMKDIKRLERVSREGLSTLVLRERSSDNPRLTYRHHRGEFLSPKEEVVPAVPAFLPQLPHDGPRNRLALARWLVSEENPLTARVVVNRHWQAFFGQGIVKTIADFGYQSSPPSHPDMLDWLAVTFMAPAAQGGLGWSSKSLHRLIVTSATYQQSSDVTHVALSNDPENTLLARGPRLRLEAEMIRDGFLKAAGLLSTKMFGPGVKPPQPSGVMEVAYGNPKWQTSQGEDRYRRGVYTFRKRTAPFAFTTTFDGPTGEVCVANREASNSPLQALTLLNDPMFLDVARSLGRVAMAAGDTDTIRLQTLARKLLSRDFDATEAEILLAYLGVQRRRLIHGTLEAAELMAVTQKKEKTIEELQEEAAWMLVARTIMNLDEAIVKR